MRTSPRAERHFREIPTTDAARAAIYVRVSTTDQTTENQERDLHQWSARLGLEVVAIYADRASGARSDRAALTEVLASAHRREFRVLLVWALDRLSREGIGPMLHYLEQLRTAGVRVMSHQESWVDTASPVWELLVAVFAWVAQQERLRIGDRVRAGQARARERGVHLGRHPRHIDLVDLRRRRAAGESWRHIARAVKAPVRTLRRAWQKSQAEFRLGAPDLRGAAERADGWGTS